MGNGVCPCHWSKTKLHNVLEGTGTPQPQPSHVTQIQVGIPNSLGCEILTSEALKLVAVDVQRLNMQPDEVIASGPDRFWTKD
jgi:hypothetical protein